MERAGAAVISVLAKYVNQIPAQMCVKKYCDTEGVSLTDMNAEDVARFTLYAARCRDSVFAGVSDNHFYRMLRELTKLSNELQEIQYG